MEDNRSLRYFDKLLEIAQKFNNSNSPRDEWLSSMSVQGSVTQDEQ